MRAQVQAPLTGTSRGAVQTRAAPAQEHAWRWRMPMAGVRGSCVRLCGGGDGFAQDGVAMLWDLAEGKRLYSLDAQDIIHALTFSPNRYWLCAATQSSIKIWDLER